MSEEHNGEPASRPQAPKPIDIFRLNYQRWQTEVLPFHDRAWDAQKIGAGFATVGLQSAFLINGGALIAVPPLMEWLSPAARQAVPLYAACFVFGLLVAGACALVAYVNFLFIAQGTWQQAEGRSLRLNAEFAGQKLDPKDPAVMLVEAQFKQSNKRISLSQKIAVGLAIISYFAFATGAYEFIALARSNAATIVEKEAPHAPTPSQPTR